MDSNSVDVRPTSQQHPCESFLRICCIKCLSPLGHQNGWSVGGSKTITKTITIIHEKALGKTMSHMYKFQILRNGFKTLQTSRKTGNERIWPANYQQIKNKLATFCTCFLLSPCLVSTPLTFEFLLETPWPKGCLWWRCLDPVSLPVAPTTSAAWGPKNWFVNL